MIKIIFFIITSLSINAFGQINPFSNTIGDTLHITDNLENEPPIVSYKTEQLEQPVEQFPPPLYFINGKPATDSRIQTLNPLYVESMNIVEEEFNIGEKKYFGKILVKLKKNYKPTEISLTDLKLKYTTIKNELCIFMINNVFIKGNYNTEIVDEKYILKINVEEIVFNKTAQNAFIIEILTKNKENIKKSKEIRIRGTQ